MTTEADTFDVTKLVQHSSGFYRKSKQAKRFLLSYMRLFLSVLLGLVLCLYTIYHPKNPEQGKGTDDHILPLGC